MESDINKIEELKADIKKTIQQSQAYKEYLELNELLLRQPDVKRQVDDYRRENFRLQYSDDVGDSISASQSLTQGYEEMFRQPLVSRYLSAELSICRLVQEICMSVVESVDFDMDFLQ